MVSAPVAAPPVAGPAIPATGLSVTSATPTTRTGLPQPSELVRLENRDGHIDDLMAREDYAGVSAQSKPSVGIEQLFMKPYMFIEREGVQTVRQKLDLLNDRIY